MNVHSEIRRRGRPPTHRAEERVVRAALKAFAERGFHGTAMPEVAKAARVGVGTIYRYFPSKEALVNAVFRDAKTRLMSALLTGLDLARGAEALFAEIWTRIVRFARAEPLAFRFLEMQDHARYLDTKSRALERSTLEALRVGGKSALRAARVSTKVPMNVFMAFVWGALVGLLKAESLGYLPKLTDDVLERARKLCWAGATNLR